MPKCPPQSTWTLIAVSWPATSSRSPLYGDYSPHGSCRFIFHRWCCCSEDWLYGTGYLTDNHMCSITISVPECSELHPLRPPHYTPSSSSSYFPISPGTTVIASPHCIPNSPHAVPGLTGCVAAASAEITTQHPGREQPADGIDYLYCQNN